MNPILTSLLCGSLFGLMYGVGFIRRMHNYFALEISHTPIKKFLLLLSFFLSFVALGLTLVFILRNTSINMFWLSGSFMAVFWLVIWRHLKKII